ncbi:AMP-binding protein [Corynebacterium sp.]|uniref:AMP-binding protein n=1 Tax=Corynebacterium sp. TaxID=1720 RepID=UPI00264742DB|nr:AMP-binding protein [Corynebacterium sp.]MDN5721488.1 AMP-binding protein [Corynebacterium sp.]MDN6281620.1 AMP-binding protein [Corynebacterium sp.]MDN6352306.1 AMP-binding protein [Corynebacterium sp.]MDN6367351.1 AMP-binding protein [Corynebacterium sp.]MDN6374879.1 AMP-binding protein [Corynebacterium sp.]
MIYLPQLTTLAESLAYHAARTPQRTAVMTSEGDETSYRQLDLRSSRLASALADVGVAEGTRVAFIGRERASYWETLFACVKLGAVLVPVNRALTSGEVEHILGDSDALALVIDGDHPLRGTTGLVEFDAAPDVWDRWLDGHEPLDTPFVPTPDTPMAQLYTSGTTGLPKGVVLAHRSWFGVRDALGESGVDWITFEEGDICFVGIPGFHIGGLWYATQVFNAGQTVFSMIDYEPEKIRDQFRIHQITNAIFVPAMMASLATLTPPDPAAFTALRQAIYGGAPIGSSVLEICIRVLDARFIQIYGLTETGNTAVCLPPEEHYIGSPRLKAAGRPYPGFQARIVDREGSILPAGKVGEVQLLTPNRMVEYYHLPEATAETLVDGWIHTGDAGYLDGDGFVYISDRYKDMVLVGGENVFPAEIEKEIVRFPGVADVAVIGVPDDTSGESVMAFVQKEQGAALSTRDLVVFLRGELARFKIPSRWRFVDVIPRNSSGKILRRELREEFWAGRERRVN